MTLQAIQLLGVLSLSPTLPLHFGITFVKKKILSQCNIYVFLFIRVCGKK